jgi:hypothetical protein
MPRPFWEQASDGRVTGDQVSTKRGIGGSNAGRSVLEQQTGIDSTPVEKRMLLGGEEKA